MGKSTNKTDHPVQLQGFKRISDTDGRQAQISEKTGADKSEADEDTAQRTAGSSSIEISGSINEAYIHSEESIPASGKDSRPPETSPAESQEPRQDGATALRHRVTARDSEEEIEMADPYDTASPEMLNIEDYTSKKWGNKRLPRKMRGFYKNQDKLIDMYESSLKVDDKNATDATLKRAGLMAKVVLVINVGLLIGKVVAVVLSGSISIIAALVDSVVDLVSGIVIWWSNRTMKKKSPYHYPQGRARLEPIAIIILAVVMAVSSLFVMKEAIELLVHYAKTGAAGNTMDIATIVIICVTIVSKIILFVVCYRIKNPSTQALSQDQRNDVLSNAVALAGGFIGARLWKFADPIGAILIALYIIIGWAVTAREQIRLLSGHVADPEMIKKVTFVAMNFHPKIIALDTVRVYHVGINFLAEVHIVLPAEMSVMEGHDIGEGLTKKIEMFPEIERAFIHVDYEFGHTPSLEHKVL